MALFFCLNSLRQGKAGDVQGDKIMAEMGTETTAAQVGDAEAKAAQAAAEAAAATAAWESAGDERSEEQKAEEAAAAAAAAEKERKAKAQEKIDRTVKLAKTEAAKERDARHKIEVEKARIEGELAALKAQGGKAGDRPATVDPIEAAYAKQHPEPDPDDPKYELNGDYVKALARWEIGKDRFIQEQTGKQSQDKAKQESQAKAESVFQEAVESQRDRGENKYDDFIEVANSVELEAATMGAIIDSPLGEDIIYHLGNNPKEAARIDALPVRQQIKEIGRLELGIETGKIVVKKQELRRVSTAPEPAPRAGGPARIAPKTIAEAKTSEERFAIWERDKGK